MNVLPVCIWWLYIIVLTAQVWNPTHWRVVGSPHTPTLGKEQGKLRVTHNTNITMGYPRHKYHDVTDANFTKNSPLSLSQYLFLSHSFTMTQTEWNNFIARVLFDFMRPELFLIFNVPENSKPMYRHKQVCLFCM
jgi:hypothetical protein